MANSWPPGMKTFLVINRSLLDDTVVLPPAVAAIVRPLGTCVCTVRNPLGRAWHMLMEARDGGQVVFRHGWRVFVEDNSVDRFFLIRFGPVDGGVDNRLLDVETFSPDGMESTLYAPPTPPLPPRIDYAEASFRYRVTSGQLRRSQLPIPPEFIAERIPSLAGGIAPHEAVLETGLGSTIVQINLRSGNWYFGRGVESVREGLGINSGMDVKFHLRCDQPLTFFVELLTPRLG